MSPHHRAAGFTLIEVLIAMALLSIMMLLLFSGMNTAVRSWDAGEKRISDVSKAAATYHFFRRHLSSIQPFTDDFTDDKPQFSFQGDTEAIKFVAVLPASAGRLGLQVFTIGLVEKKQDSSEIQVAIEPFFAVAEGQNWRNENVVLIDQVESLEFAYFGIALQEKVKRWHPQWLDQFSMPELIKIMITLKGGVVWPEIVVEPRILKKENPEGGDRAAGSDDDDEDQDEDDDQNDSEEPDSA